jgi:tetratricopeptide (TPR) repeat protein
VKVTGKETFNNACLNCHQSADACKEKNSVKITNNNNCVACHMPKSGTIDIPHVTVHDHWIRKPAKQKDIESMKTFAGIYCINNTESSALIKANAFINYVEKFEGEKSSLDSANSLLNAISKDENVNDVLDARIHLLYLQNQDEDIIAQSRFAKIADIKNPWMTYRVGQAFQNAGDAGTAENWYSKAVELAPENLEFINKWAGAKIQLEKNEEAIAVLDRLLSKNPKLVDAFVNKGFALLKLNRQGEAMACYNQALQLDCDNHQALLNRAGLLHLMGKDEEAKKDLKHLLKLNPQNKYVKDLLSSL